jgi:tetratricopeptide (TPR) repeat protein
VAAITVRIPQGATPHLQHSPAAQAREPVTSKKYSTLPGPGLAIADPHRNRRGLLHRCAIAAVVMAGRCEPGRCALPRAGLAAYAGALRGAAREAVMTVVRSAGGLVAALVVAVALALAAAGGAPAQSDARREHAAALDSLFEALKAAPDEDAARPIAARIWQLWLQSGDAALDARMRLAIGFMNAGRGAEALLTLDEIIAAAPTWAEAWNKRATLLYMLDEHDRSLTDCFKVLELEPRHFGALSGMGLIGIAQGNYEAALKAYRRAMVIHPFIEGRKEIIPFLEKKVGASKT